MGAWRVTDDRSVAHETARYPAADITPSEFEQFVVELIESVSSRVDKLEVTLHDRIEGPTGFTTSMPRSDSAWAR